MLPDRHTGRMILRFSAFLRASATPGTASGTRRAPSGTCAFTWLPPWPRSPPGLTLRISAMACRKRCAMPEDDDADAGAEDLAPEGYVQEGSKGGIHPMQPGWRGAGLRARGVAGVLSLS